MKAEKEQHKKRKRELRKLSWFHTQAQREFNKYIRLRDDGLPCISCGRLHEGQWHAGHYLSTGSHPHLRYHELNCHRQCQPCNAHLSGNAANYRKNLIHRIGEGYVEWLERLNEPRLWSRDELDALKKFYQRALKEGQQTESGKRHGDTDY